MLKFMNRGEEQKVTSSKSIWPLQGETVKRQDTNCETKRKQYKWVTYNPVYPSINNVTLQEAKTNPALFLVILFPKYNTIHPIIAIWCIQVPTLAISSEIEESSSASNLQ